MGSFSRLLVLIGALAPALDALAAPPVSPTPAQARWTSLGVTSGGLLLGAIGVAADASPVTALGATAFFVGPSAGHIQAGEWGHAAVTSPLRVASLLTGAVILGSTSYCLYTADYERRGWNDRGQCALTWTQLFAGWGSIGLSGGLMLYDLYDAGRAPLRVADRRARRLEPVALRVSPRFTPGPEGSWGVRLDGSF